MASRRRDEWLSSIIDPDETSDPLCGLTVRAGPSRSPRVVGRLWLDPRSAVGDLMNAPLPPTGRGRGYRTVHYGPPDDIQFTSIPHRVQCWEDAIDELLNDASSSGPCIRLEALDGNFKPYASWQDTNRDPTPAAIQVDPVAVLAAAQADLMHETRRLIETCNGVIQGLSSALVTRDTMLVTALSEMTNAHVTASQTIIEAGLLVTEGTIPDDTPADTSNLEAMLMQIISNFTPKAGGQNESTKD